MSVGVNPPKTPVTTGSKGIATATLPNVCKMPGRPAPFVPAPLPNIGKSGNNPTGYTTTVKVEGNPVAINGATFDSIGDIASKGTGGGMVSANTQGPCKFIAPGSMDVKFEGENVHLLSDQVTNNGAGSGNPANAATMMGLIQITDVPDKTDPEKCPTCKAATGKTKSKDRKSYDEFFSQSERESFAKIATDTPELAPMLPPVGGMFKVLSVRDAAAARARYRAARKKAEMTGNGDELHHPHSIKTGGCPIHQKLVEKPSQEPEKSQVQKIDDEINDIHNSAITRNSV